MTTETPPLEDRAIAAIGKVAPRFKRANSDYPAQQLFILQQLDQKSLGMTTIAELLGQSTAAATGVIDRLETLGWVKRSRPDDDRRRIYVTLTPEGEKQLNDYREALRKELEA